MCFWRFGQVLHGIYLQLIHFSKSVFGALAKCCMGFTCNSFTFPNLFLALWPSAAWDLLAVDSLFQICFWRFGQVLHGIYLQFIQFSKSVSGTLAKCCMGFTCNVCNVPNLFLALWPSAAWDLLAIYSISKSVSGALAKCCMGFTCNLFNFPNLFLALWPSAAWDLLAMYSLFQICFWALWPSAAWDLLAIYSLFQICFWRFGQVLHGIYLQFIHFSKSVFGALAKCCMGFTCIFCTFPNLFRALWPSAAWDLLAIYSIFQICFWRFGQVLHGIYLQFIHCSKSVFGFWPSAAWDLLAFFALFQICFWRFGQVLHRIYLQFIQFSKSFLGALANCCMGFTCNSFKFQICFGRFGQVLHGIYLQFIHCSKSVFGFWPSAAWDFLAFFALFQICFWRFGQVLHGIYLQFIKFSKSFLGAFAMCCM